MVRLIHHSHTFHTLYSVCQNMFIITITFPLSHATVTSQQFSWTTLISDSLLFAMNLCSSLKVCVLDSIS